MEEVKQFAYLTATLGLELRPQLGAGALKGSTAPTHASGPFTLALSCRWKRRPEDQSKITQPHSPRGGPGHRLPSKPPSMAL